MSQNRLAAHSGERANETVAQANRSRSLQAGPGWRLHRLQMQVGELWGLREEWAWTGLRPAAGGKAPTTLGGGASLERSGKERSAARSLLHREFYMAVAGR